MITNAKITTKNLTKGKFKVDFTPKRKVKKLKTRTVEYLGFVLEHLTAPNGLSKGWITKVSYRNSSTGYEIKPTLSALKHHIRDGVRNQHWTAAPIKGTVIPEASQVSSKSLNT